MPRGGRREKGNQFFEIFRIFFVVWALVFEFVLVWIYVSVDFVTYLISK